MRPAVYYKELCRGLSLNAHHSVPQIIPELLRLVIEFITARRLSYILFDTLTLSWGNLDV